MSRKIVNFSNHTKIEKIAKPNFLDGAFLPLFFLAVQIFLQSTCGNRRWISASGKKYKSNLITFSAPRGCGKAPPGSPFLHRSVPQSFRPYGNSQWTCTFFRNLCTSTRPDSKRLKHAPPFPPFNDKRKKASGTDLKNVNFNSNFSLFLHLIFLFLITLFRFACTSLLFLAKLLRRVPLPPAHGGSGVPGGAVEFSAKKKGARHCKSPIVSTKI